MSDNTLAPLPMPTGDELAGALVDLASDAWALRGRVTDLRGIRAGFSLDPVAYDVLRTMDPDQRGAVAEFVTYTNTGAPLLCGIECRREPGLMLPSRDAGRWQVVLSLAPGDPT